MGNLMMTDKASINITEWSPEYIRKYLEKHMKSSHFKEDAINKLLGQDVDGWLFLKLTEEKLTRKNGPYELKPSPAERIIELVERLKEKQEIPPASVKVITAIEFKKFLITDINHLTSDVNTTKEDIKGINGCLII
ncbi:5747_t:CDS:2 [Funneliformis caledonium]|uniref:5747_t:CDS:1 n=1 Tax=Funneliformis caledonium TaxID=1117310 RepID=A0A9N9HLE3_9GLOM|nr:5747_t:CDS:2 [Funneliformis caledonium]